MKTARLTNIFWVLTFVSTLSFSALAQDANSTDAREFVLLLNAVRANPSEFIPKIDEYANEWKSFVPNKKAFLKAISEAKTFLKSQQPLPPMQWDTVLLKAATDHADDGLNMGSLGHIGSDGTNPLERVQRYDSLQTVSEIITYGQRGIADMLAAFIVDHDTPDRGHRTTVFSPTLNSCAAVIIAHAKFRTQCVVVLAKR